MGYFGKSNATESGYSSKYRSQRHSDHKESTPGKFQVIENCPVNPGTTKGTLKMSDKENPQDVIEAYRKKRQQRSQRVMVLFIVAAVLLIGGFTAVIIWLTGDGAPQFSLFATDTPTPTVTFTVTPTFTPTSTPTVTPTETPTPTVTITPTQAGPFIYEVAEGDSCWAIAVKFQVDPLTLITINNLDPTCPIRIGDKLTIPGPDTTLPTGTPVPSNLPRGTEIQYRVQTGDTLGTIAVAYNSTVEAIKAKNNIQNENEILVGMTLIVPVNLVTPVPTNTPTSTGTVTRVAPTITPSPTRIP
jgi:LysM repeat protein